MNYRALGSVAAAAAIAFAQPVAFLAQTDKAAEIIAAARKAIGGSKLDAMKTFSLQSAVQRNINNMQMGSDVEIVVEWPDKYLRAETPSGGMVMAGGGVSGFNGDRPLQKVQAGGVMPAGGGMMIRMGGSASFGGPAEKLTPEQIEQMTQNVVRNSRIEASRLMLGWFANAHPSANAEYRYAGEAESVEGKAFVIDVTNADNFTARLFIDEQTNLPLMVTYKGPQPRMVTSSMAVPAPASGAHAATAPQPGQTTQRTMTDDERKKAQADVEKQIQEMQRQAPAMVDYALYFEEWRDVDGVKFPFKLRRAMAGTTTEEWTVNKVKVNPKIDPKRFAGES
jgi:hypothetical protein